MDTPVTSVDFHFDIMCPWAYQASIWVREVRDRLGVQVRWRFFSLEEINRAEGKKHPWQREWSYGWSMMRIGALLRRINPALLDRWYLTAGTARGGRGSYRSARARSRPGRPGHRRPQHARRGAGGPRPRDRARRMGRADPGVRR